MQPFPALDQHDGSANGSAARRPHAAGVSEDVIRDQLGHRDTGVTRSHYIRTQVNPNIADFAAAIEGLQAPSGVEITKGDE